MWPLALNRSEFQSAFYFDNVTTVNVGTENCTPRRPEPGLCNCFVACCLLSYNGSSIALVVGMPHESQGGVCYYNTQCLGLDLGNSIRNTFTAADVH